MTPDEKKVVPPPEDEDFENECDRATRSVPAILLAEIYGRPPSNPPPPPAPSIPTNGTERMIITDEMLGKAPRMPTETVKMAPLKPRK